MHPGLALAGLEAVCHMDRTILDRVSLGEDFVPGIYLYTLRGHLLMATPLARTTRTREASGLVPALLSRAIFKAHMCAIGVTKSRNHAISDENFQKRS